ncbi:MAG: GatB/YqeY domain-containing protein [Polyangiaceae bacterium]
MVKDDLKKRSMEAMKAGDDVAKGILRLALGEVQTTEARLAKDLSDDDVVAIVKKLLKSNEETFGLTPDGAEKDKLAKENGILKSLLPASLGVDAIVAALASVAEDIRAAKSEGQATGVAMKALKAANANVNGTDVAAAVKTIRG